MSYIDKSLGDGETIIARAHFHWLYVTAAWLCLLVPGCCCWRCWARRKAPTSPWMTAPPWRRSPPACCSCWGCSAFLRMMIRKWSTEIGVTSHRFVEKYGLLSMRTNEIALPNIEGVQGEPVHPGPHLRLWHGPDRRHRRGFGDHAQHRRSGGICARHPDGARNIPRAVRQRRKTALRRLPPIPGSAARGKLTVTRVPWPRALSIAMRPPCRSTSALVSGRPRPVPS